jgi:hypothetical protein
MPIYLEVTRITIVPSGTDKLILHVGLPEGCYPFKGDASVTMEVAQGNGWSYCQKHFPGVPVEDLSNPRVTCARPEIPPCSEGC